VSVTEISAPVGDAILRQLSAKAIRQGQIPVSGNRIFENLFRVADCFTIAVPSLAFKPSKNCLCGKAVVANELIGMMQSIVALRRCQTLIDVIEKRLHHRSGDRQSFAIDRRFSSR